MTKILQEKHFTRFHSLVSSNHHTSGLLGSEGLKVALYSRQGSFTNYVDKQGRGVAKCQRYNKSLCCKLSSQQGEKGSANEVCG